MEELLLEKGRQANLFFDRVPKTAYCTNDFSEGLKLHRKEFAKQKKHIQFNPTQLVNFMVFDLDKDKAHERWFDMNLPPPTLIVQNPNNGHAHLIYALRAPVSRTEASRIKPLRFLAAIEEAYRLKLGADAGYAGLICKTPHHAAWRTFEAIYGGSDCVYDLGELAEYVSLSQNSPKRLGIRTGLGRNIELFDRLRGWAYKWKDEYKNFEKWEKAVLSQCEKYNDFSQALPISEVKSTAKSVAKWVWQKYTGRMDDKDFSKLQSFRSSKQKRKITKEQIKEVLNGSNTSN